MSDSVRPHRQQPIRLPRPWDSPGKNTGVRCHFLLQCMKMKSESQVAQLCPTLSDPMDYSLQVSSVHGIFQARVLEWGAIAFSTWGLTRSQKPCWLYLLAGLLNDLQIIVTPSFSFVQACYPSVLSCLSCDLVSRPFVILATLLWSCLFISVLCTLWT